MGKFKMRKPNPKGIKSPFEQEEKTEEQIANEKRLAEIRLTRARLNKEDDFDSEESELSKEKISTGNTSNIVGGVLPGGPGDFYQRAKKLITLDYGRDAVNETD